MAAVETVVDLSRAPELTGTKSSQNGNLLQMLYGKELNCAKRVAIMVPDGTKSVSITLLEHLLTTCARNMRRHKIDPFTAIRITDGFRVTLNDAIFRALHGDNTKFCYHGDGVDAPLKYDFFDREEEIIHELSVWGKNPLIRHVITHTEYSTYTSPRNYRGVCAERERIRIVPQYGRTPARTVYNVERYNDLKGGNDCYVQDMSWKAGHKLPGEFTTWAKFVGISFFSLYEASVAVKGYLDWLGMKYLQPGCELYDGKGNTVYAIRNAEFAIYPRGGRVPGEYILRDLKQNVNMHQPAPYETVKAYMKERINLNSCHPCYFVSEVGCSLK